jgi:hypothetical protein
MLAELLPGVEGDEDDSAFAVARVKDDGRTRSGGRVDLVQLPVAHAAGIPEQVPR